MRFWDTSAILPLLLRESFSAKVEPLYRKDSALAVWCFTEVEIHSALARRVCEHLSPRDERQARERFATLQDAWSEIDAVQRVKARAARLLHVHPLRAADALQLAAALVLCEDRPERIAFVCLDQRLTEAARKEGFPIQPE